MFGSLERHVAPNEVVGTASGADAHSWELEDDSSGRMQLRDTSHLNGTSHVCGVGIRMTAASFSEDASVMAHLQSTLINSINFKDTRQAALLGGLAA